GKSSHKLRDYALSVSGGATPKKTEGDKYYADKETGVPFLRVQNLNTDGTLSFDDCLYINKETHEGMLSRSQVSEGDLLVKITGVGRMAIASVAPEGFIGNTNQHMVVVKTVNKEISKYLARYLNLDIIEKIASRHSTGGTRPALDYPSVKNLPIIEGLDFSPIDRAIEIKKQKESEAQQLLDSIDAYILNELGITLPEIKSDLKSRIFLVNRSDLEDRLDPKFNKNYSFIKSLKGRYTWVTLRDVSFNNGQYGANESAVEYKKGDVRYIRITDIDEYGNLKQTDKKTASNIENAYLLKPNDILFARSGSVGRCYIHKFLEEQAIFAGYLIRYFLNENLIDADYLFYYCNSNIYKYWVDTIQRPAVQANINAQEYRSMPIPLPPIVKQKDIVNHIYAIRQQAKQLQEEGKTILENAKKEVEQMILV
ncbi:MAG: restriction endonuclease subunit S, partial [Paludibacteraceae bacterium]|nr:restriction endonuclease subunit S [Paludibacteraceae bacterium]